MTTTPQDVSVIICGYTQDRWDNLVAAVESLEKQTVPPLEIIVVIDHNPALLKQAFARLRSVVVVENTETQGLSGARNSGIKIAQGQIIAFLDDDAIAAPNWIQHLINAYDSPSIVGVGGSIDPIWPNHQPKWFPKEFLWVVGCTYLGLPERTAPVRNMIGANMSFRREVFDVVGMFSSSVGRVGTRPVGCEETELCIRVHQHWPQGVILYEPQARVQHQIATQRTNWAYFRARCYAEGQSKAQVAEFVGATDGLASERTYTLRTLPRGVGRGIADATGRADWTGILRAGAIVAGLGFTTAGYLQGIVSRQLMTLKSLINRDSIPQNV